jgi:chorismate mutase
MKESNQQRIQRIMKPFRKEIDDLDDQIMKLLGKRYGVIRKVAKFKHKNGLPSFFHDRVEEVRNRNVAAAKKYGIKPEFIYTLYSTIIYQSCGLEDEIKAQLARKKPKK